MAGTRTGTLIVCTVILFNAGCHSDADSTAPIKRTEERRTIEVLAYNGPSLVKRFSPEESRDIYNRIQKLVQKKPMIGLPEAKIGPDVTLKIRNGDDEPSYQIYGGSLFSLVDESRRSERKVWHDRGLGKSILNRVFPGYLTDE